MIKLSSFLTNKFNAIKNSKFKMFEQMVDDRYYTLYIAHSMYPVHCASILYKRVLLKVEIFFNVRVPHDVDY